MDFFHQLTTGVSFDRRRFKADMERFRSPHSSSSAPESTAAASDNFHDEQRQDGGAALKGKEKTAAVVRLPDSLDFFHSNKDTSTLASKRLASSTFTANDAADKAKKPRPLASSSKSPPVAPPPSKSSLASSALSSSSSSKRGGSTVAAKPHPAKKDIQLFTTKGRPSKSSDDSDSESDADAGSGSGEDDAPSEQKQLALHRERIAIFRKQHKIHVQGTDIPDPLQTFDQTQPALDNSPVIAKFLQKNIAKLGYTELTPIQMQAIPTLLARREVLAHAQTGSGKTAAFAIPILQSLEKHVKGGGIRAIVVSPTRELAQQIYRDFNRLAEGRGLKICVLTKAVAAGAHLPTHGVVHDSDNDASSDEDDSDGGEESDAMDVDESTTSAKGKRPSKTILHKQERQQKSKTSEPKPKLKLKPELKPKPELAATTGTTPPPDFDVLVTTPLRLVHILQQHSVSLASVEWLVFDEADNLFSMGFLEQVDEILAACTHPHITRALFSATMPPNVEEMARTVLHNPVRIGIGARNTATETIKQRLLFVGTEEGKKIAIRQLVQQGFKPPVLIFVQSVDRAKQLHREMLLDRMNVDVIHSERSQVERENAVKNFRLGKVWFLIATELLARGMDFKGVNLVVNFDFPQTAESYIHRIGRTGRAGRPGEAVTFFTKEDSINLRSIVNVMKESGCEIPDWMLSIKKPNKKVRKQLARKPIERDDISAIPTYDKEKMRRKRQIIEQSKTKHGKPADPQD